MEVFGFLVKLLVACLWPKRSMITVSSTLAVLKLAESQTWCGNPLFMKHCILLLFLVPSKGQHGSTKLEGFLSVAAKHYPDPSGKKPLNFQEVPAKTASGWLSCSARQLKCTHLERAFLFALRNQPRKRMSVFHTRPKSSIAETHLALINVPNPSMFCCQCTI